MFLKTSNARRLFIAKTYSEIDVLDADQIPLVAILTAWSNEKSSLSYWENVITSLVVKGVKYVACIGTYSEKLHDEIDNLIWRIDNDNKLNIVTTYHVNDTIEEAVLYCVYATELKDSDKEFILAILDDEASEDREVQKCLEEI